MLAAMAAMASSNKQTLAAQWLDRTLSNSRGIRRIEDAKLYFPEEMPDNIVEEAKRPWKV
jgi:haloalkane dehalogenase